MIDQVVHYVLSMDVYLAELIGLLGPWAYGAIFATIFAETGLIVTPFLPGESLLLASGTLAGAGLLHIAVLAPLLFAAAFLGDECNFLIGRFVGRHLLNKPRRHLRPEHVQRAHELFEHHVCMAIVLARYLPIVRTLAPFVAGVARMEFHRFLFFAAVAAATWVTIFVGAGYWFGTVPWVKDYLALALAVAMAASAIPAAIIYLVRRVRLRQAGRRGDG
jgi:membrane-associated protein